MKLPKITPKQEEILLLLYRYRFLNRIQIQALLRHKDKRRVIAWLKDLREKQYVGWIYSTDFIEKTKPAIYYIGINGVRFLKRLENETGTEYLYLPEEVRKRYRDNQRSRTFVDHSVLVADCCISLEALNHSSTVDGDIGKSRAHYAYITEADYIDSDHDYHFLAEHEILRPNLCIMKQKGRTTTSYLLEIFDATLPRYRLRSRLKAYVKYLDEADWEAETSDDNPPIILLVLPHLNDLIYAKRATRKLLLDTYYETADIPRNVHIRFTTSEQLRLNGIAAELWEEGRKRVGL